MIPDGEYTAVLDRTESDRAAFEVTVGDGDRREITVPVDRLPDDAAVDSVVTLRVADATVVDVTVDPAATESHERRARRRFDRLSERLGESGESEADADEKSPDESSRDAS